MTRFNPKAFLQGIGEGKAVSVHPAGTVIMKQGTEASHVFYLQSGRAKETVTSENGKEALVGILGSGLFFGTGGLDGHKIRLSTVTAIDACVVTTIERDAMLEALKEPAFSRLFVVYLLHHNSQIEAEKVDLLFNNTEKRLAQRLLVLAHVGDGPPQKIGPEITQEMLADMVGAARSRVNKFLVKFKKLGLISYNGGITVRPGLLKMVLQDGRYDKEE